MLLIFLPCAVLFGLAAMFYSEPVLTLQDDGTKADVIVVPGGDGPPRAAQAARLWKEGRSPLILITGDGDCLFNKQIMVRDGVNPSAILVECQSGSTWQNAYYSVPVMREIQARKASFASCDSELSRSLPANAFQFFAHWGRRPTDRLSCNPCRYRTGGKRIRETRLVSCVWPHFPVGSGSGQFLPYPLQLVRALW